MGFKVISQEEAKEMLQDEHCQLIDVRDANAFSAGHIKGACNVGEHNISQYIAEADPDKPLIICCYAGRMSQNVAQHFVEQGFEKVYSIDGGFNSWKHED